MNVSRWHLRLLYLSNLLFSLNLMIGYSRARALVWAAIALLNIAFYTGGLLWTFRGPHRRPRA